LIKVISGVRRCGKSTLLKLLAKELKATGIPDQNMITINMVLIKD
jgi:predicted AAA+ superfamily ATPase